MKTKFTLISLLVLFASSLYAAGLVDISYSNITISQPGSYIVVCDLTTGQDLNCITIATSNVTIDLNGHTLYGAGTTVGASGHGIYGWAPNNLTIKNGIIRDFWDSGIYFSGRNNKIMHIQAYGNGGEGIANWNNGALVQNCCVEQNGGYGILASTGSNIMDNIAHNNGFDGIITGTGCRITGNSAYNNTRHGIWPGAGCTVKDNSVYNNGTYGIYANSGCTVIGNSAYSNDSIGIFASTDCSITGNTVYSNSYDGISFSSGCLVTNNCVGSHTGDPGIHARSDDNFIGQNLCTDNGTGILCDGVGNYLEQNKLRGNTTNVTLNGSTEGGGVLANVIIP
jgi:parallel beta-helix repeat protein